MKNYTATVTVNETSTRVSVEAASERAAVRAAIIAARAELDVPAANGMAHEGTFAGGECYDIFSSLEGPARKVARVWIRENSDRRATQDDTAEVRPDGTCGRCGGTGKFVTYVENGKPRGPGGECFRCQGKGYQTLKDAQRNIAHDMHQTIRL